MGRPINKRYFGPPTADGSEIKVRFYDTANTAEKNGWIVKQLGSKKFRVTDGVVTEDCFLSANDETALVAGNMTISVKDDAGNINQITKITGRVCTLETGVRIPWNFSDADDDDAVEIEEAGDDASLTNADDFVPDVP